MRIEERERTFIRRLIKAAIGTRRPTENERLSLGLSGGKRELLEKLKNLSIPMILTISNSTGFGWYAFLNEFCVKLFGWYFSHIIFTRRMLNQWYIKDPVMPTDQFPKSAIFERFVLQKVPWNEWLRSSFERSCTREDPEGAGCSRGSRRIRQL